MFGRKKAEIGAVVIDKEASEGSLPAETKPKESSLPEDVSLEVRILRLESIVRELAGLLTYKEQQPFGRPPRTKLTSLGRSIKRRQIGT